MQETRPATNYRCPINYSSFTQNDKKGWKKAIGRSRKRIPMRLGSPEVGLEPGLGGP